MKVIWKEIIINKQTYIQELGIRWMLEYWTNPINSSNLISILTSSTSEFNTIDIEENHDGKSTGTGQNSKTSKILYKFYIFQKKILILASWISQSLPHPFVIENWHNEMKGDSFFFTCTYFILIVRL